MFHKITLAAVNFLFFLIQLSISQHLELIISPEKLPYTLINPQVVYDGQDSIFLLGGVTYYQARLQQNILKYSLTTDSISVFGSMPNITSGSGVWADGNDIYYFGGLNETEECVSSIWKFDTSTPNSGEIVAQLPSERQLTTAVWDQEECIYIIGGNSGNLAFDTIVQFTKSLNNVTNVAQLPTPLYEATSIWNPNDKSVYVFGGSFSYTSYSNEILKYDSVDGIVNKLDVSLPLPSWGGCAFWNGTHALILAPATPDNDTWYPMLQFDPIRNEVIPIQIINFPWRLSSIGCTFVQKLNRIYIFGGYLSGTGFRDQIMYVDLGRTSSTTTTTTTTTEGETPSTTTMASTSSSTSTSTESSTVTTPENPDCSAMDKHGTHFEANIGEYARNKCPGKSVGVSSWLCLDGGMFNGTNPDYSNCSSVWLSQLEDIIAEGTPISVIEAGDFILHMKQNLTYAMNRQDNVTIFGHEIKSVFRIGENVLDLVTNSSSIFNVERLTSSTFSIYSQLLSFSDAWEELSPSQSSESGTEFITAAENSALSLANRLKSKDSTFPYRKTFDDYDDFKILSGLESTEGSKIITFPETYNPEQDSYIEIPNEWIESFSEDEFASFSGLELSSDYVNKLFPASIISNSNDESTTTTETEDENSNTERIINSKLLSFTFNNPTTRNSMNFTENGVKISFRHDVSAWGTKSSPVVRRKLHSGESAKTILDSGSCAYWDTEKLSWSTNGCFLVSSERDVTICECNHLTSFALIMDLHNYIGKDLALEILTLILCPISIICLILSLAIFTYSRHKRQIISNHPRNELTFHLCLSLLIGNLLMLITMDKHYLHLSDGMCIASAIILHYVLLCAFSWMALEGILLSKLIFIDVFSSGREFIKYERAAAFAIPGIIVIITCAINFGKGDHGYGNDSFCWLDGNYLWSFIVPVAIVVTFNTVVLIMSIRKSYMVRNHSNLKIHRDTKSISFWIRGSLSLTIIMGVTWIFGFLMLINNSTMANIAAYIFTLLNASQGIFIFIFHIVLNEKVRTRFSIFTVSKSTWGTPGQTNANSSPQTTKNVSSKSTTN